MGCSQAMSICAKSPNYATENTITPESRLERSNRLLPIAHHRAFKLARHLNSPHWSVEWTTYHPCRGMPTSRSQVERKLRHAVEKLSADLLLPRPPARPHKSGYKPCGEQKAQVSSMLFQWAANARRR
jgi:hypothetical protein